MQWRNTKVKNIAQTHKPEEIPPIVARPANLIGTSP